MTAIYTQSRIKYYKILYQINSLKVKEKEEQMDGFASRRFTRIKKDIIICQNNQMQRDTR